MGNKLLTESGLKAVLAKHKIKDNGLLKALAAYEKLKDDAYDDRLAATAQLSKLAASVKKAKEVAANDTATDYLEDLFAAAQSEEKAVAQQKAAALKASAAAQKKADEKDKEKDNEEGEDEDEEEEEGDYGERLLNAFRRVKSLHGKPLAFIVCDARPLPNVMVAKRISSKHKEELTEITGGSRKFLKIGSCYYENDHYVFAMEQSVPGLARKLQKSIKNHTGKKLKLSHGGETVGEEDTAETPEEGQESDKQSEGAKPQVAPVRAELASAPEVWRSTLGGLSASIDQLKSAVMAEFGGEEATVLEEVWGIISRFDGVLLKFDNRLADSLAKAGAATDPAARSAELKNSKSALIDLIEYVKTDELIAHIDANPFGVDTNLKHHLAEGLKSMAEAIGKSA